MAAAKKSIAYILSQLPTVEASLDYDEGRVGPYTFQPALNMKMMAPSPPRTVNMLTVTQVKFRCCALEPCAIRP